MVKNDDIERLYFRNFLRNNINKAHLNVIYLKNFPFQFISYFYTVFLTSQHFYICEKD